MKVAYELHILNKCKQKNHLAHSDFDRIKKNSTVIIAIGTFFINEFILIMQIKQFFELHTKIMVNIYDFKKKFIIPSVSITSKHFII